ncbi:hypothetical protein V6Z11_D13G085000 [Gossypium hirsutum]
MLFKPSNFGPNPSTIVSILKSCKQITEISQIHGCIIKTGLDNDPFIISKLLLSSSLQDIKYAASVFKQIDNPNLFMYNCILRGFSISNNPKQAFSVFNNLRAKDGIFLDQFSFITTLKACGRELAIFNGQMIHGLALRSGHLFFINVKNTLLHVYSVCGRMFDAHNLFDESPERNDVVSWNTLMACAASGAINIGLCIGNYVEEEGMPLDAVIGTALVDMYAKCGVLNKAVDVFHRMESKDVKSWTAMISGYGVHGFAQDAIRLFYQMEEEGFRPNEVTFLTVLSACSHGGLITEGTSCFEKMIQYGILPKVEHYGCIIDLFGRAGLLEEAHDLIKSLPIKGDATAWRALLSACRVYGNVELGECVKGVLVGSYNQHPTDSILLSSTYAIAGRLQDQTRMQAMEKEMLKRAGIRSVGKEDKMLKEAGYSIIEMDNEGFDLNS